MSDYSEAELLAIEKCFPGTKVFLCNFHREQTWEKWVKDGLTKDEQEDLLSLLRACANAPPSHSQQDHDQAPNSEATQQYYSGSDGLYNLAVTDLKASDIWKKHQEVQQWLTTTWLCIPKVIVLNI